MVGSSWVTWTSDEGAPGGSSLQKSKEDSTIPLKARRVRGTERSEHSGQ